jgi:hypothetical protein
MKPIKFTVNLIAFILFVLSCNVQDSSKIGVVAERKGELIVCDRSLLKETITIPLSFFTEELQMVKLDNADEALVKESSVEISENFILVKNSEQVPCKLFERKTGKFITTIGNYGQGPGEYQNIYDQQIDEENDRIYLLPWNVRNILIYDLKGEFLGTAPLCFKVPKGNMKVDTKAGTVIVSALPFTGIKAIVWQQTLTGELLKSIEPGHLAVQPDFSNEMGVYKKDDIYGFNIFTFAPRIDSAYHYDVNQNRLTPVFTMEFNTERLPIHVYNETNDFFMGDFSEIKKINSYTSETQNHVFYLVEKKTLRGAFFTLENDYLGGLNIEWPIYVLSNEYYAFNTEPANLREKLEEVLSKNNDMTTEIRDKLIKLKDSISDNENNYIFYAKYKHSASLDNISKDKIDVTIVDEEQVMDATLTQNGIADNSVSNITAGSRYDEVRRVDPDNMPVKIDIIGNRIDPPGKVKLSRLFENIEYITIKQTPDTINGRFVISPNYIYNFDTSKGIAQFNRNGDFIRYICKNFFPHTEKNGMIMVNREQSEKFYGATDVYWNKGKLFYKYEDRPERKTFMIAFDENMHAAQSSGSEQNDDKLWLGTIVYETSKNMNNSKFIEGDIWVLAQGSKGIKETAFLTIMSATGDTLCSFKDFDPIKDYKKKTMRGVDSGDSYLLNGTYNVRQSFNDTLYEFRPPNILTAKYILDFGDMGIKSSNEGVDIGIGLENKLVGPDLFESEKYLFVTYTKDYSCPNTAISGSLKYSRLIYDKNNKSLITLYIDKAADYKGTGWPSAPRPEVENDLDGMPIFWPTSLTSEGKPFTQIAASEMLKIMKRPEALKDISENDRILIIYN